MDAHSLPFSDERFRLAASVQLGLGHIEAKTAVRIVGNRKLRPLSVVGSGALPLEESRFNEDLHRLPGGPSTFVRKGVYRFKTHDEANRHDLDCITVRMATIATERRS